MRQKNNRKNLVLIRGGMDKVPRIPHISLPALDPACSAVLNKSPCIDCDLFERGSACPHFEDCDRIDRFQRKAAACFSYRKHSGF